jgi:hypothetical protein
MRTFKKMVASVSLALIAATSAGIVTILLGLTMPYNVLLGMLFGWPTGLFIWHNIWFKDMYRV